MNNMKNIIRLAIAYIRYYKKQAVTLLMGIILSAALFTGIGSLFESGRDAALENVRIEYGNWHYNMRGDAAWAEEFEKNPEGKGYQIEKYGVETVRKAIETPYAIQFVYADSGYLDIMGRKLKEGYYPKNENEIALDSYTMTNLKIPEILGSQVVLDDEEFILSGILTDMPEKLPEQQGDFMQVFVNETLDYGKNGKFLYLKFVEDGNVYKQIVRFAKQFGINGSEIYRNNAMAEYVGAESPATFWTVIKTGLQYKEAGLPFIWGQLNSRGMLTEKVILIALGLFGIFIIYSLFQISIHKRMSQYSVMQTIGMSDKTTFGILIIEMSLIFVLGYPIGTILGNGAAAFIYKDSGQIFITQNQTQHTGTGGQNLENAAINLPDAGNFHISWHIVLVGAIFLFVVLFIISFVLVKRMKKITIRQMIAEDTIKHPKNRKIYSIKQKNMTGILTKKFMFSRKRTFLGILFSLSVGSVIFLGASYVTENTKIHNELTFKADDGLASDIQIYEASDQITDVIPESAVSQIENISGLKSIYPVRYLMGEIPLNDGKFLWTKYYAELANDETWKPDEILMEKYNGVAVKTGEDDYSLKVNIYGYDDEMLLELGEYLLEGEINPEKMREENSVILKTLMDGQGNYGGVDVTVDDFIQIKTIRDNTVPAEALRFLGESEWYQEKSMKVTALTTRPLAKVDTFIGDSDNNRIDIIMTNEQMKENFGISDYQAISVSVKEDADIDTDTVLEEITQVTSKIGKCVVKDYSQQIKAQNLYLTQKMMFFYGIAAILLGISILHIMNSMQYLVTSRKHEFGIMRAMGITDWGFYKMLAKEGLRYGVYSGLVITVIYFIVQKVLYYFMIHIYMYLHPKDFLSWIPFVVIISLNLIICIVVVIVSGRSILKMNIIQEIRE